MKCLKNKKTGTIIRIDNEQAAQMKGSTWFYVSKSEWKADTRKPKPVVETKEETVSKKQLKSSKK